MNFVFKLGYCRCRVNPPNFSFRDFTRETKKLHDCYLLVFSHHFRNLVKTLLMNTTYKFMSLRNVKCFDAKHVPKYDFAICY